MNFLAFFFIVASLLSFVVAQLVLKRAMQLSATSGLRNLRFISLVGGGIALMTISFFLTLGLLQRFPLSYLYPFQGLSVIIISLMAAVMLKEKLTLQLTVGGQSLTAALDGQFNFTTRQTVLNGVVLDGWLSGAQIHEEGQVVGFSPLTFVGTVMVMRGSAN